MSHVRSSAAPLKLAFLADLESIHTRRWLTTFRDLGHEVHALSFYRPEGPPQGIAVHPLVERPAPSSTGRSLALATSLTGRLFHSTPSSLQWLAQAARYLRAGLRQRIETIDPDILHAHYVVENGFFAALTGFRPLVISAWGSDLLVDSRNLANQRLAAWTLKRASLVTANDSSLAQRAIELGVQDERAKLIRFGVDEIFLAEGLDSRADRPEAEPTVISTRALEPLYNVDTIVSAFAQVHRKVPEARLLILHEGSQRGVISRLVHQLGLGAAVEMRGTLASAELRDALRRSSIYVSIPSSDSMAVSTLEAMAMGCFPILSNLPSQADFITGEQNGLLVPPGDVEALAQAITIALRDPARRAVAQRENQAKVAAEGNHRQNMLAMECHYLELRDGTAAVRS